MASKEDIVFSLKSKAEKQALKSFALYGSKEYKDKLKDIDDSLTKNTEIIENIFSQTDSTRLLIEVLNEKRTVDSSQVDFVGLTEELKRINEDLQKLLEKQKSSIPVVTSSNVETSEMTEYELSRESDDLIVDPVSGLINVDKLLEYMPIEEEEPEEEEKPKDTQATTGIWGKIWRVIFNSLKWGASLLLKSLKFTLKFAFKGITGLFRMIVRTLMPILKRFIPQLIHLAWLFLKFKLVAAAGSELYNLAKVIYNQGFDAAMKIAEEKSRRLGKTLGDVILDEKLSTWEKVKKTGSHLVTWEGMTDTVAATFYEISDAYISAWNWITGKDEDQSLSENSVKTLNLKSKMDERTKQIENNTKNLMQKQVQNSTVNIKNNTSVINNYDMSNLEDMYDSNSGVIFVGT